MDALTQAALVGTARIATDALTTNTPIDALVPVADGDRERTLLLRAGALAIYREAGQVPERRADPLPAPAPDETQPLCSPAGAAIVQILLKTHQELLPEALDRLIVQGLRLPPELVPTVLATRLPAELRPQLRRVLGMRGQWLARFDSAWAWATEAPLTETASATEAETIWQEGQPSQRIEIFTRMRATDPAQTRAWLAATWRREKADMRAALLSALTTNLGPDDEPFLEAGLDDKLDRVRIAATKVLATLPGSAFVARMTARADALLTGYAPGALHLSDRITWVADFARDGLTDEPPRGIAKSDWLLRQVLGAVPPDHWAARFGAAPADLIAAACGNPYEESLLLGWSGALTAHAAPAWLAPLWEWWAHPDHANLATHQLRTALLNHMPQIDAEARLLDLIDAGYMHWAQMLLALPTPWSASFARAYLERLLTYVADLAPDAASVDMNWASSFTAAAQGIPTALMGEVPPDLATPWTNLNAWQFSQWTRAWQDLQEVIALRLRIANEIGPAAGA